MAHKTQLPRNEIQAHFTKPWYCSLLLSALFSLWLPRFSGRLFFLGSKVTFSSSRLWFQSLIYTSVNISSLLPTVPTWSSAWVHTGSDCIVLFPRGSNAPSVSTPRAHTNTEGRNGFMQNTWSKHGKYSPRRRFPEESRMSLEEGEMNSK